MDEVHLVKRIVKGTDTIRRVIELWLEHWGNSEYPILPSFWVALGKQDDGIDHYRFAVGSRHENVLDECIARVQKE